MKMKVEGDDLVMRGGSAPERQFSRKSLDKRGRDLKVAPEYAPCSDIAGFNLAVKLDKNRAEMKKESSSSLGRVMGIEESQGTSDFDFLNSFDRSALFEGIYSGSREKKKMPAECRKPAPAVGHQGGTVIPGTSSCIKRNRRKVGAAISDVADMTRLFSPVKVSHEESLVLTSACTSVQTTPSQTPRTLNAADLHVWNNTRDRTKLEIVQSPSPETKIAKKVGTMQQSRTSSSGKIAGHETVCNNSSSSKICSKILSAVPISAASQAAGRRKAWLEGSVRKSASPGTPNASSMSETSMQQHFCVRDSGQSWCRRFSPSSGHKIKGRARMSSSRSMSALEWVVYDAGRANLERPPSRQKVAFPTDLTDFSFGQQPEELEKEQPSARIQQLFELASFQDVSRSGAGLARPIDFDFPSSGIVPCELSSKYDSAKIRKPSTSIDQRHDDPIRDGFNILEPEGPCPFRFEVTNSATDVLEEDARDIKSSKDNDEERHSTNCESAGDEKETAVPGGTPVMDANWAWHSWSGLSGALHLDDDGDDDSTSSSVCPTVLTLETSLDEDFLSLFAPSPGAVDDFYR